MHYLLDIAFFFNLRKQRTGLIKTEQDQTEANNICPLVKGMTCTKVIKSQIINLNDLNK